MTMADLVIDALRQHGTESLPGYEQALRRAFDDHPPPFGMAWYGERYRSLAVDPAWLAKWLVSNAEGEGWGAGQLWALAGRIEDTAISELVCQHAIDESRHSRYYVSLLRLGFPGVVDGDTLEHLQALSPGYGPKDRPPRTPPSPERVLIDELIQMNIGEIRTRTHQQLLRPVLSRHCAPENRERVTGLIDVLLSDETRHIEYTARIIEQAHRRDGNMVEDTMARRVADFNQLTIEEVGEPSLA